MTHVVVRPMPRGILGFLREVLDNRELLSLLVRRDVSVRYKQTFFGVAWAVAPPALLMIVFTLFLGRVRDVSAGSVPYALSTFTALVPWMLFAQSLSSASNSLVENSDVITKVYFPRVLLPLAATCSFLLDMAIGLVLIAGALAFYGISPWPSVLFLPLFIGGVVLAAVAVGVWLSALNARYRDVKYALPVVMQVWLMASPVAYSIDILPESWVVPYSLNPMVGIIEGFRWCLVGAAQPPMAALIVSGATTVIGTVAAFAYFHKVERALADVV